MEQGETRQRGQSITRGHKWCRTCGRKHHRATPCRLFLRDCIAKSGKVVKRWAA